MTQLDSVSYMRKAERALDEPRLLDVIVGIIPHPPDNSGQARGLDGLGS